MVKEQCAVWQRPCGAMDRQMPTATFQQCREHLKAILEAAPGGIPLSNVKRLFRSRYQLALSETVFGHSRLSDLLQDERFSDLCQVELEGHGYTVRSPSMLPGLRTMPSDVSGNDSMPKILVENTVHSTMSSTASVRFRSKSLPSAFFSCTSDCSAGCHRGHCDSTHSGDSLDSDASPCFEAVDEREQKARVFCPDEPLMLEEDVAIDEVVQHFFSETPWETLHAALISSDAHDLFWESHFSNSTEQKSTSFCPNEPLMLEEELAVERSDHIITETPWETLHRSLIPCYAATCPRPTATLSPEKTSEIREEKPLLVEDSLVIEESFDYVGTETPTPWLTPQHPAWSHAGESRFNWAVPSNLYAVTAQVG